MATQGLNLQAGGIRPWLRSENNGARGIVWSLLTIVIVAKTAVDGLQFVPGIGPVYFAVLCTLLVLAPLCELSVRRDSVSEAADRAVLYYASCLALFLAVETVNLWRVDGGGLEEVLKTATPFIILALWPRSSLNWTKRTIVGLALALILVNAVSAAFPFAWISWGGVNTFKGVYYFKTDLAYALVTALLLLSIVYARQSVRIAIAAVAVGAMVVLTNSRLNYLTFAVVLTYITLCNVNDVRRAATALLMVALTIAVSVYLFDESTFLSPFDTTNTGRFTQGRELIWEIALSELTGKFGLVDWLFGKGPGYDSYLGYRYNPSAANNAHNEVLHLVLTRGLFGLALYVFMWFVSFRFVFGKRLRDYRSEAVWGALIAFVLFFLQGLTGNVSEFSTKTWPLLFALLLASTGRRDSHE